MDRRDEGHCLGVGVVGRGQEEAMAAADCSLLISGPEHDDLKNILSPSCARLF